MQLISEKIAWRKDIIGSSPEFILITDFLGLVQEKRYHWTAWCFHPKSSPCLLSDWDYTPTPYWGKQAKAALAGEAFEIKKRR